MRGRWREQFSLKKSILGGIILVQLANMNWQSRNAKAKSVLRGGDQSGTTCSRSCSRNGSACGWGTSARRTRSPTMQQAVGVFKDIIRPATATPTTTVRAVDEQLRHMIELAGSAALMLKSQRWMEKPRNGHSDLQVWSEKTKILLN
jgi:hypothetical protein